MTQALGNVFKAFLRLFFSTFYFIRSARSGGAVGYFRSPEIKAKGSAFLQSLSDYSSSSEHSDSPCVS